MITDEMIEKFCTDTLGENPNRTSLTAWKTPLNRLKKYEDTTFISVSRFTKAIWVDLFNENEWTLPRSGFSINKSKLTAFLKYLQANELADCDLSRSLKALESMAIEDLDQEINYDTYYFSSYVDFWKTISTVLEAPWFIRERTMCGLAWIGLKPKDVCNLTVNDIDYESNLIYGKYEMTDEIVDCLERLIKTESYVMVGEREGIPVQKTIYFGDSPYVFKKGFFGKADDPDWREKVDDGEDAKISKFSIVKMFIKINKELSKLDTEDATKRIKYNYLTLGGFYCTLYDLENEGIALKTVHYPKDSMEHKALKEAFDLYSLSYSSSAIKYHYRQYTSWKKFFGL